MSQTTKTVTKIKVSPQEMTAYKEDALKSMIAEAAQQINNYADILLSWAKANNVDKNWSYIDNKDVYYIPEIVGVMPNLVDFNTTLQQCSNANFTAPSVDKMTFGGFSGNFPTAEEATKCFGNGNRYFRDGIYIKVKGENRNGVTCISRKAFTCYNTYRGGIFQKYGEGNSGDYGWNIPIFRFNGENSAPVTLVQTILYWLQYDLRHAQFKSNKNIAAAFDTLRKCHEYLTAIDDKLELNTAKVNEAIHSGESLSWMPKEASDILSAKTLTGNEKLVSKIRESFLHCDERAVALDPYDEKLLTDPNRGHWDLWDMDGAADENNHLIELGDGFTARNPAIDVSDGIVAIDFGTKSTVVVYETDELQILPLQVGSGTYSKGFQAKNYENPTIIQFIDLDSFLAAYKAKTGRPATSWDDITVSHNAFQNLKDASSDKHGTFFDGLKQWCGTSNQKLKLQDSRGKTWELPSFMELQDQDMDPLEIYAYYLGRYINHMLRGKIFLHYVMSFPVTYEHRIREHMGNSIRRGLKKSFPTALLANEELMKKFCLLEVASEPAAYAITALQEYNFEPEEDEQIYYAVFDFGGGTTDFDFGMFKESEEDRYDYTLIHFGENGDRTLGGENLLRLLAFEVFRANKDYLLHPDGNNDDNAVASQIPFAWAPDTQPFAEQDSLIKDSSEAKKNMRNLMEKLRPVWEEPESKEATDLISSGQIQLTLYRKNGEKKTDANLKLKIGDAIVDLQGILKNRIEKGIQRFFTSLAEAFDKSAGTDSRIAALSDVKQIYIFLAGNSSKSPLVTELFRKYIGDTASKEMTKSNGEFELTVSDELSSDKGAMPTPIRKILKFGDEQPMPEFVVLPPLGTEEADKIRKDRMNDKKDTREPMMRPTGKTGVAYGLLKCRDGGEIKVETITPDGERVPFQYYIGRRKKGKFSLVIDRNAKLKTWYKFIDAGGAFDILYTDRPEAATGDAPMTIAKQKHISIEKPDKTAFVYIRPAESRVIEYIIAHNENELTAGGADKNDPKRIELE